MTKIMIVDDDQETTNLLESFLKMQGYEPIAVNDSTVAIETANATLPNMFLLDLMMPVVDGFKLCRMLRDTPRFFNTPIIIITALDDKDSKIVAFGAAKAKRNNLKNLEFRLGDLQNPPIEAESVDLVILSQALHHAEEPGRALAAGHRILKPGGQIMVLDLAKHTFAKAHELYGDRWLGFAESDLQRWLEAAGFRKVDVSVVAREEQPPHFETVLASGQK